MDARGLGCVSPLVTMNIRHDESTARFLTDADFAGVRTYALQVAPPTQATNLSACAGGPFHHSGVGYQLTSLPDLDPPAKRRKRKSRAKPKEKWVALAVPRLGATSGSIRRAGGGERRWC